MNLFQFIQAEMIKMKENLDRGFKDFKQDFLEFHSQNERSGLPGEYKIIAC